MNSRKYQIVLYTVAATIVATVAIQFYWNFMNYKANKAELVNQVQLSLDNSLEAYYTNIARSKNITVFANDSIRRPKIGEQVDEIIHRFRSDSSIRKDSVRLLRNHAFSYSYTTRDTVIMEFETSDSMEINMLASKIFISINNDKIDFERLGNILKADFDNKNWPIDFGLTLRNIDCEGRLSGCDSLLAYGRVNAPGQLSTQSQSALLPSGGQLTIFFSNITSILLRKSLVGIFLSLLLSGTIIFCLLYLFQVIKNQKQLAEIKNDLISNITHEFKTPITTVVAALEGIQNFNALQDKQKAEKYVTIGQEQLSKLNNMVEKLLETASLDSEHLVLNKKLSNPARVLEQQLEKYRLSAPEKEFIEEIEDNNIELLLDSFHFESVIANLLDNATKYGGNKITVALKKLTEVILINISDNGTGISKNEQTRIFDKFYRIPTGNVHNVKGFGIGLYYAKNIIEKHGGTLHLKSEPGKTAFIITLPYVH